MLSIPNLLFAGLFPLLITDFNENQSGNISGMFNLIQQDSVALIMYPDNVMAIIENKCMGCHKPDARNEKARKALQWKMLPFKEKEGIVSTLDEMTEILDKGEMPPEKMLERYPDKKLTEEETTVLKAWAENNLEALMK